MLSLRAELGVDASAGKGAMWSLVRGVRQQGWEDFDLYACQAFAHGGCAGVGGRELVGG